jgi:hypothetical protein
MPLWLREIVLHNIFLSVVVEGKISLSFDVLSQGNLQAFGLVAID